MLSPNWARAPRFAEAMLILGLAVAPVSGCRYESAAKTGDPAVPEAPADGAHGRNGGDLPAESRDTAQSSEANTSGPSLGAPDSDGERAETIAGFRFTVPENWKRAELTPRQQGFIDARFLIPAPGSELQLTCSSTGGGVQANIDRWIAQFRLAPGEQPIRESLRIDGADATWVDLTGTFDSGMPGSEGPQENWRMLGVAIAGKTRDFYLKLVGPREAVAEVRDDFRAFVRSARLP
jgi:hypothetical protein